MEITKEDLLSCSVHLSEDERAVVLLDQTQLPNRTEYLTLDTVQEIYDAIKVRSGSAQAMPCTYWQENGVRSMMTLLPSSKPSPLPWRRMGIISSLPGRRR